MNMLYKLFFVLLLMVTSSSYSQLITTVDNKGTINKLDSTMKITVLSSDYTAKISDYTFICDASSAGFQVTLPAPSPANAGKIFIFKKADNTDNVITISPPIEIDLTSTYTISELNIDGALRVQSSGFNWFRI